MEDMVEALFFVIFIFGIAGLFTVIMCFIFDER